MAHSIDVSRGSLNSTVSNQWMTRSDDEKFLDLQSLRNQVADWRDASYTTEFAPRQVTLITDKEQTDSLMMRIADGPETAITPFGFDRLASLAGCPSRYMRKLPAALAAANLRYGLLTAEQDGVQAYRMADQNPGSVGGEYQPDTLRGITSPRYGRIYDVDVVD